MIQHSQRFLRLMYEAARRTRVIHISAEKFRTGKLEDLQMYEFNGQEFFQALSERWQYSEEADECCIMEPIKGGDKVVVVVAGGRLA
jgi:hypothetical protein